VHGKTLPEIFMCNNLLVQLTPSPV